MGHLTTAAIIVLSALLIAEFVFAPINLWTGRTIPNFERFTGLSPLSATRLFAPAKLVTATALAVGLAFPGASIAGASSTLAICAFYLLRLRHPSRRDPAGLAGFSIFAVFALALLALQALR